ncbi:MAG: radical SAM protein [Armatimonadetes bacterium]|nr:radical SAM protein [Armatimonadota bacterium]
MVLYPGPYEEAMASLSIHVLLDLFSRSGWAVERACDFPGFSGPVRTIETGSPIGDADVLLVSAPFELQLVTLAGMLARSGINPIAREREFKQPLVVVGGPAPTGNPAPWCAVADAVYVGELEASWPALAELLAEVVATRDEGGPRSELAGPGIVSWCALRSGSPTQHVPRQVAGAVNEYVPRSVVLAPGGPFGGRALVEVSRGCPHACRFCLARAIYEPHRPRSAALIRAVLEDFQGLASGIGFVAPSFAAHPEAIDLVEAAQSVGLSASAPSLRADLLYRRPELLRALRGAGQETISLAPEAATDELRRRIGKPLPTDCLLDVVASAAGLGFAQIKLYFMIGLPYETRAEVEGFARLFQQIKAAAGGVQVSASVACFVPKPHTQFESAQMIAERDLQRRIREVARAGEAAGVRISSESPRLAWAQAAVARGTYELGEAVARLSSGGLTPARLVADLEQAGVPARQFAEFGAVERPWAIVNCAPGSQSRDQQELGGRRKCRHE